MAEEEKIFVIPLGSLTKDVPRIYKSKVAMREIKNYISKHMKVEDADASSKTEEESRKNNIWIDPSINDLVWSRGGKKVPTRIKVKAIKFEGGLVEISPPEDTKEAMKEAKTKAKKTTKVKEEAEEETLEPVEDEGKEVKEVGEETKLENIKTKYEGKTEVAEVKEGAKETKKSARPAEEKKSNGIKTAKEVQKTKESAKAVARKDDEKRESSKGQN